MRCLTFCATLEKWIAPSPGTIIIIQIKKIECLASSSLIKSDKWPFLTKLAIATVSPISFAIPMSWSILFILC